MRSRARWTAEAGEERGDGPYTIIRRRMRRAGDSNAGDSNDHDSNDHD